MNSQDEKSNEKNKESIKEGDDQNGNQMKEEIEDGCPAHLILVSEKESSMDIPKIVHLKKVEIMIGRQSTENDLVLDSTLVPGMISRKHAKLMNVEEKDEEGRFKWKIVDNSSVNGVFVNDIKVSDHVLEDGDVITFGGGGKMAMGTEKKQPQSEFVFEMRYRNGNALKRKLSRGLSAEELEEEAKKKQKLDEELLRVQNLAEKLKKRNEEMEVEKEKERRELEEQNSKVSQELSKLQEENERILQEHQKTSEDFLKKMEEKKKKDEELEEEVTCTICSDLIAVARTLQCSHSFCGVCIHMWMKKSNLCPFCKAPIKELIRSRVLDNTIEKIVKSLPQEDQDRFEQRANEYRASEKEFEQVERQQDQLNRLTKRMERSKKKNRIFVPSFLGRWSDDDRRKFHKGLSIYTEPKARAAFCAAGGLTPEFTVASNVNQLKVAATNVGLKLNGVEHNGQELKRRLSKFIEGTLDPSLVFVPPKK